MRLEIRFHSRYVLTTGVNNDQIRHNQYFHITSSDAREYRAHKQLIVVLEVAGIEAFVQMRDGGPEIGSVV